MAIYLLSLPEMQDPAMEDGTTGFAMALARRDLHLIKAFLSSSGHPSGISQQQLVTNSVRELERIDDEKYTELKETLTKHARLDHVPPTTRKISEQ